MEQAWAALERLLAFVAGREGTLSEGLSALDERDGMRAIVELSRAGSSNEDAR
jgi:hypothetical protein